MMRGGAARIVQAAEAVSGTLRRLPSKRLNLPARRIIVGGVRSDGWPAPLRRFLGSRRRARFQFLISQVRTWDGMRVIDLGCGREGRSTTSLAPPSWQIVGVDRAPSGRVQHRHPGFTYRRGDVTDLSEFEDGSFDLAVSVGLLEHVTEPAAFAAAAAEIQRVAAQYALVVPFRYAWIEPHYFVPFYPILHRRIQNGLVRVFNLHGQRSRVAADPGFIDRRVTWRSNAEYRAAFPGSRTVLMPTKETVAIVKSAGSTSRSTRPSSARSTARGVASARRRQHGLADRFRILPAVGPRIRARLEAAIATAERRRPGAVAALDAGCGRRSALAPFRPRLDRFVGVDVHAPETPVPYLDAFIEADLCAGTSASSRG